jgi:chromosome segregation ATPase
MELSFGTLRGGIASMLAKASQRQVLQAQLDHERDSHSKADARARELIEQGHGSQRKSEQQLSDVRAICEQLRKEKETDGQQVDQLHRELASKDDKILELAQQVVAASEKEKAACSSLAQCKMEMSGYGHCSVSFEESYTKVVEQVRDMRDTCGSFADALSKTKDTHDKLLTSIESKNSEIANLRRAEQQLRLELEQARTKAGEERRRGLELERSLQSCQRELALEREMAQQEGALLLPPARCAVDAAAASAAVCDVVDAPSANTLRSSCPRPPRTMQDAVCVLSPYCPRQACN